MSSVVRIGANRKGGRKGRQKDFDEAVAPLVSRSVIPSWASEIASTG